MPYRNEVAKSNPRSSSQRQRHRKFVESVLSVELLPDSLSNLKERKEGCKYGSDCEVPEENMFATCTQMLLRTVADMLDKISCPCPNDAYLCDIYYVSRRSRVKDRNID